ncbi:MAG: hypothetical protein QXT64_03400, partial [Desulfurococcaceae archaeon]
DTSISIVEILRHITWTSLSLAQLGATTAQPGESPPPSVVTIGGFDGSSIRMLRTDSDGRLQVGVVSVPVTKGDWLSVIPNPPNLDVPLSTLSRLVRWGRDVSPVWVHGSEVTAPPAGTALVSRSVSTGKTGYVYGFCISAGEPNDFRINWTSGGTSRSVRVVFPGGGSLCYVDIVAVNEGSPADSGTTITITNVNAGSTGVVYQAGVFYAEV